MTDHSQPAPDWQDIEDWLIEEVARVIRDTSFCGFSEPDGSRSYCSRESAAPKSCECFDGARAILPIIRRIHNEAIEKAANVCGSLAETTYDDADGFQAATGCEAAIRIAGDHERAARCHYAPMAVLYVDSRLCRLVTSVPVRSPVVK